MTKRVSTICGMILFSPPNLVVAASAQPELAICKAITAKIEEDEIAISKIDVQLLSEDSAPRAAVAQTKVVTGYSAY